MKKKLAMRVYGKRRADERIWNCWPIKWVQLMKKPSNERVWKEKR
jgi:hypothetical protein